MARNRGTTEMVRVAALMFDPRVNRDLSQARVDQIAAKFDEGGLGVITVSEREDGRFVVIDGQHRVAAIKQRQTVINGQRIEAKVFRGLTVADEARLFVELNNTRQPHPIQRYIKGVTSKDERLCAIDSIVKKAGLTVSMGGGDGHLRCVNVLQRAYDSYGEKHLAQVLHVAISAWGRTDESVNGSILEGLSLFLGRYTERVDIERLITKLSAHPGGASGLLGTARGSRNIHGSSIANNVAAVLVIIYNKGRRSNALPDWWTK